MLPWDRPPQKRVLILGGTRDAAELAQRCTQIPELQMITSLAGRTRQPGVSSENTRMGGFGGVSGLVDYLTQQQIDILIDATHPFAAQISIHAAAAASQVGIPHVMLIRPVWDQTDDDRWLEVASHPAAADLLPRLAQRIFLTIGRQELATFAHLRELWFLMRMIELPTPNAIIPPGQILLERGSFSLEHERSLLQQYQIEAIVSKNSGGDATYAKILAARELGIPVVMIQRPTMPQGEKVIDVDSALLWLRNQVLVMGNG